MKIGDCVFQLYGGMHRYGSVKEINRDMNGDGWTWLKIDWIDDSNVGARSIDKQTFIKGINGILKSF